MFFDPPCFGQGLTLGAVAVTARVIGGVLKATEVTLLEVATEKRSSTVLNGAHDPEVRKGQRKVVAITLAIFTENVGQFELRSCWHIISNSQHVVGLDH